MYPSQLLRALPAQHNRSSASIQAAVDGNVNTDWDPNGGGIAYSMEFEYPTCVEPQQFVVLPLGTAFDRTQWTIQAGNTSGQYTFSLPTFNTAITGAQKTFSFSSPVCARLGARIRPGTQKQLVLQHRNSVCPVLRSFVKFI